MHMRVGDTDAEACKRKLHMCVPEGASKASVSERGLAPRTQSARSQSSKNTRAEMSETNHRIPSSKPSPE